MRDLQSETDGFYERRKEIFPQTEERVGVPPGPAGPGSAEWWSVAVRHAMDGGHAAPLAAARPQPCRRRREGGPGTRL